MKKYGRIRSGLVVTLAVFLVAACGSDGGVESPDTTQAVVTSTTAAPATSAPADGGDPDDGGGNGGIGGVSQTCIQAAQAFASAFGGYATFMSGMTPEQARDIADQLAAVRGSVPSELRDDYEAFADMIGAFYTGIADLGFQPGAMMTESQIEKLGELVEELEDGGWEEVSDRIGNWFEDNCS